ncbi:hypothetical protein AB0H37_38115 [Actinomadura sp. NPDC023710]|uniref:hypothetical protein n=1 Tax=Actinomadura sp. NPDC023710 TaxID=3158219 RepID=UPI0033CD3A7B
MRRPSLPTFTPANGPSGFDVLAARNAVAQLVEDNFANDPVAALLELADPYIGVAYLDPVWFAEHVGRGLTHAEQVRLGVELRDSARCGRSLR